LLDGNTKPVTGDSTWKMFGMVITERQVGAKENLPQDKLTRRFPTSHEIESFLRSD